MRIRGQPLGATLSTLAISLASFSVAPPVLAAPVIPASLPAPTWTSRLTFDVRSGSVAIDADGNVYVTGLRVGDEAIAVIGKIDPDGVPLWTRTWTQPRAHTMGTDVAVAPDGSVYLAGTVGSDHFEGGGWFVRRYDMDGTLRWARDEPGWQHGRTSDSTAGLAVSGETVILAGSFNGCCGDLRQRDGWVMAFAAGGRRLWRSRFEPGGALNRFSDQAEAVFAGPGRGIYVGGWTALGPESDEHAANHELFMQKLDPAGNVLWSRTYPSVAARDQDFGVDLAVRGEGLMVSALVDGQAVQYRARPGHSWLARLTLSGELVWSRTWGTSWTRAAGPAALAVGATGMTFVVGTKRDPSDHGFDGFIRAFSRSGQMVWDRKLQASRRFVLGADVAVRRGALFAVTEALDKRHGEGIAGILWRFAVT